VSIYSVLAKYNFQNYTNIVQNFRYNNLNAGVNINMPIFSSKTRASIALAQANLDASKINLSNTRTQVSAEVRQRSRKVQQTEAAKEVARLELQLVQQNVAVLQSQFGEGKANLRDMERARLDENEKWMAYLDANFRRQLDLRRFQRTTRSRQPRSESAPCLRKRPSGCTTISPIFIRSTPGRCSNRPIQWHEWPMRWRNGSIPTITRSMADALLPPWSRKP
jgi:hypothetical protein